MFHSIGLRGSSSRRTGKDEQVGGRLQIDLGSSSSRKLGNQLNSRAISTTDVHESLKQRVRIHIASNYLDQCIPSTVHDLKHTIHEGNATKTLSDPN